MASLKVKATLTITRKLFKKWVHKDCKKKYVHIKSIGFVVNSGKKMVSASIKCRSHHFYHESFKILTDFITVRAQHPVQKAPLKHDTFEREREKKKTCKF